MPGGRVALRVEVDHQDPVAQVREGRAQADRGRGLADAALLVRDRDDAGRAGSLRRDGVLLRAPCDGREGEQRRPWASIVTRWSAELPWRRRSSLPAHDNERPRPCKRRRRHQARYGIFGQFGRIEPFSSEVHQPPAGVQEPVGGSPGDADTGERSGEAEVDRLRERLHPDRGHGRVGQARRSTTSWRKAARGRRDSTRVIVELRAGDSHHDPGEARSGSEVVCR